MNDRKNEGKAMVPQNQVLNPCLPRTPPLILLILDFELLR
jgi:hypothetical protein